MGFGLLFFFRKKEQKKSASFSPKAPLQHESLSQPKVPPQHITTLLLIFVFLPPKQHSSTHK